MQLVLTLCVGTIGGLTGKRLKLPAGAMIGAMIAVVIFGVSFGDISFPAWLRVLVQIFSGIIIGSGYTRNDVRQLRQIIKPAILLTVLLLFFTIVFAVIMFRTTTISLMTALFCCAPGGVSDLALISADLGANPEQVTLLQLCRFVFVISFFPPFLKRKFSGLKRTPREPPATVIENIEKPKLTLSQKTVRTLLSFAAGSAGGYGFRALGIPAGAIIGALVAITVANIATERVYVPDSLRTFIRVCAGCYIGSQVTRHTLLSIKTLFFPILIVIVGVFAMSYITAYIIHKATGLEFITCLFSSIPGGIAEMGLIAEEMGLDTPKIIVMHTCRVIAVICMFPIVVQFFI